MAAAPRRDASAVSLEVFVLNQLSTLAQETSGRGQAAKDVREAAVKLLGARRTRRRRFLCMGGAVPPPCTICCAARPCRLAG